MKLANYLAVFSFWTGKAVPACQQLIRKWLAASPELFSILISKTRLGEQTHQSVTCGISHRKQWFHSSVKLQAIKLQEYNGWDLVWIEESNLGSEGFAHTKGPQDKCERSQNVYIYIVNHLKTKQKTFVFVCLNKQKKNQGQWMRAACQQMDIV